MSIHSSNKQDGEYEKTIKRGLNALILTLRKYVTQEVEIERTVRIAVFLKLSGLCRHNSVFEETLKYCLSKQKEDGGWIDVEDTFLSVKFLKELGYNKHEFGRGLSWLKQQEILNGGWGRTNRDIGRIPLTGLLLYMLPELLNNHNLKWLQNEWRCDLGLYPNITYKGALFLMATRGLPFQFDVGLYDDTIEWLVSQQNDDFGWGPWRGHPVGSSPFCTGVALVGLLQFPDLVDRQVIVNGLEWIRKKQLPNGLWPDHYIEEGSAWCLYALTEGYRFLKNHP